MRTSIKKELAQHVIDKINDGVIDNTNRDDWHHHCFNEDYYIVYHAVALGWLKEHDLDAFEAIETVREYEMYNFGLMTTEINPERIVNMLAYIYGEELLYSTDAMANEGTVEELEEELKQLI
jgi:hypothetical protein